jgi:uncharacterized protein YjbI with pentapeptide repeats
MDAHAVRGTRRCSSLPQPPFARSDRQSGIPPTSQSDRQPTLNTHQKCETRVERAAVFRNATFGGLASFGGARFNGNALFGGTAVGGATFSGGASFRRAIFSSDANFGQVIVGGDVSFGQATFEGPTTFYGATFTGKADFGGDSDDPGATFRGRVDFGRATFAGEADFGAPGDQRGVTFAGPAAFNGVTFEHSARFRGATFEVTTEFGPVHVYDRLWLDGAVFLQRVRIEASALRASLGGADFRRGANVRLGWAEVWLEDAQFGEPSLIAALPARPTPEGHKGDAFLGWEKPADDETWTSVPDEPPKGFSPHVLSLRGSSVANLTLAGVHLEECRFAGAHGLDDLGA